MTDNESQEQIETAAEGPVHEFHNIKLAPFSFDRNACWERCGFAAPGSNLESFVAIVFICTLTTPAEWDLIDECRDKEKKKAMRKRLVEWCKEHGINGESADGVACAELGQKIWKEMKLAKFTVQTKPAIQAKGTDDPNG